MKKIAIISAAALLSASAFATGNTPSNGVFLGVNGGYGVSYVTPTTNINKRDGITYGILGGYKFNQNFGAEIGYTSVPNVTYFNATKITMYYIHLAVRGIIPMEGGMSVFGKLGGAYAHDNITGGTITGNTSGYKLVPFGAIGFGYMIAPNLDITATAAGTYKSGDEMPPLLNASLGLEYTIPA